MEYWGFAVDWDEVVFRGDPEQREFVAFWLKDRRVLAGMRMNVPDVGEEIETLIRERKEIDTERLADGETPLEEVTTEPVGRREKPRSPAPGREELRRRRRQLNAAARRRPRLSR